ncbi:peptidoglycan DD-metalloendopeptidase family protein [Planococcus sp. ANT_H30]|uniref:murein hydrolase activator EnvC family protein n=1 Tax=Planococcus sp. ANT_H30 TaxID=2597347 RepID=UPI0011ED2D0D|nr:M23 family metallopeptidase [Planococcus sp. ANT_H30]KAA0955179.1 peptidoglycan DD-metalloendopeptidase family protein [Planococcus sp. ANT_H30]
MSLKSKWIVTGLVSALAITLCLPTTDASPLSELEKKQQDTEQKKSELNSGIQKKSNEINENQTKLTGIMMEITELDNKITEVEFKIADVQEKIDQTQNEIDVLKKSISELEKKIAERDKLLQERARAIQLSGGSVDYIDVLLGANSFIDFIDRISAVNTLLEADREIMLQQTGDKTLLSKQQTIVETKMTQQRELQKELQALNHSLADQKNKQNGLAKEVTAEQKRLAAAKLKLEDQFEEEIEISAELEQQIADEQARLAELARKAEEERKQKLAAEQKRQRKAEEARIAAERKAAKDSGNKISGASSPVAILPVTPVVGSPFISPADGRHTSGFGGRDIGDGAETHLGYDIANETDTPIVAAATGYVSYSGVMGGYGKVVILTHSIEGQTYATVYGHMSSINVSTGQAVSQGEKVGGMGSTGRSTGTHVHFEVHVGTWNGSRSNAVDPSLYIR